MSFLDLDTQNYYKTKASELFLKYLQDPEVNAKHFSFVFPQHRCSPRKYRVLDVGCGTGRDLLRLIDMNYDAFGLEPSQEMMNIALSQSELLKNRVLNCELLDDLKPPINSASPTLLSQKFDGVLCSAVLHHIPRSRIISFIYCLQALLETDGRLYLTIPDQKDHAGTVNEKGDQRDRYNRIYNFLPKEWVILLFERIGFQLIDSWSTNDVYGRNQNWNVFVFSLSRSDAPTGLETIEKIISKEQKTSTYKLALLRSICEIALSSERTVFVSHEGVYVPLGLISQKFFTYYWPLVGNPNLPQHNSKNLAFEDALVKLKRKNPNAVLSDWLSPDFLKSNREVKSLLGKIGQTIIKNPVRYAGGPESLKRPFNSGIMPFGINEKSVIVAHDVWREMALFGRWILDSLLIQWAQWTGDIACKRNSELIPSDVRNKALQVLLTMDLDARDTTIARSVFDQQTSLDCVWSGRNRLKCYDVDHILPFSHFRNNDLWNLVPAAQEINRRKSDKLPDKALLDSRKENLRKIWDIFRKSHYNRFVAEAENFTGVPSPDNAVLFDCLRETILTNASRIETWKYSRS